MTNRKYLVISSFTAETPTGDKQLRAGQIIRLPEKSAVKLIEMGKVKELDLKSRITEPRANTQPVSQETLNAIFQEVTSKLEDVYIGGSFEPARIHHPELYQAERDALNQVDVLWVEALAGKVSLEMFRVAVDKWRESVKALIEGKNGSEEIKPVKNRITEAVPTCALCGESLPENLMWTGRRYCFGQGKDGWQYGWFCIRCRPWN